MKEKTGRCRTPTYICNREDPSENSFSHLEGFWVGHEEKDKRRIKGVFCFEGQIHLFFTVRLKNKKLNELL